jgi:UDP-N-acetylmuramate-alanine ligase
MILGSKKVFATIAVAAALTAGIGVGSAGAAKPRPHALVLKAAVQYIGVSRAELLKDARAGQTLAQIATAHGKSVAGLEAAMLAAIKAKLEARNLTPAQLQARQARAEKLVNRLVNAKLAGKQRAAKASLLRVSAKYIGVKPQALRAELKAGKSLAEVATSHGKTAAGLKAAILKPIQTRLDRAVAAGRLTSVQAQARLDRLSARLDKLIAKTR